MAQTALASMAGESGEGLGLGAVMTRRLVSQCTSLSQGNRSQDDKLCGLGPQSGLGAELRGLQFLQCVL